MMYSKVTSKSILDSDSPNGCRGQPHVWHTWLEDLTTNTYVKHGYVKGFIVYLPLENTFSH